MVKRLSKRQTTPTSPYSTTEPRLSSTGRVQQSRCCSGGVSKLVFYAQSTGTVISGQCQKGVSKLVSRCFTPSQPVRLYQGDAVEETRSAHFANILLMFQTGETQKLTLHDQRHRDNAATATSWTSLTCQGQDSKEKRSCGDRSITTAASITIPHLVLHHAVPSHTWPCTMQSHPTPGPTMQSHPTPGPTMQSHPTPGPASCSQVTLSLNKSTNQTDCPPVLNQSLISRM